MANKDEGTFFDVLIDRLVADVRREFEAGLHREEEETQSPASANTNPEAFDLDGMPRKVAPAAGFDDLVSKMIGFRARMAAPAAPLAHYHGQTTSRFSTADIQQQLSSAKPKLAEPRFASSEAEVAYALVLKSGAKFLVDDLDDDGITREALKRERRRVLLTLHPDRVPEADRARAHESFLQAAEAFTTLAEAAQGTGLGRAA